MTMGAVFDPRVLCGSTSGRPAIMEADGGGTGIDGVLMPGFSCDLELAGVSVRVVAACGAAGVEAGAGFCV